MPRPSYESNLRSGILTVNTAARISGLSAAEIRRLIDDKQITVYLFGESKECRIPAGPFLLFCKDHGLPITTEFAMAARHYEQKYVNPNDLRATTVTLPLTSPSINTDPIYATAHGPASFVPTEQAVSEMTPYQSSPFGPSPESVEKETDKELSSGNQTGTDHVESLPAAGGTDAGADGGTPPEPDSGDAEIPFV